MTERRSPGNAAATGFGFGLGGCLGLLAIPVIGLLLLANSCESVRRDVRSRQESERARASDEAARAAAYQPSAAEISLGVGFPTREGRSVTFEVNALNQSERYLISANVECDVLIGGVSAGQSLRGVQQMLPQASMVMKHEVKGIKEKGEITTNCAVTKARFGKTAQKTVE